MSTSIAKSISFQSDADAKFDLLLIFVLFVHFFYSDDTPLLQSAANGHIDICELLIQSGADINAKNKTYVFSE